MARSSDSGQGRQGRIRPLPQKPVINYAGVRSVGLMIVRDDQVVQVNIVREEHRIAAP